MSEHNISCPLCRQIIGEREEWSSVDETVSKMRRDITSLEKRINVSDCNYQNRLKKKDVEINELKNSNVILNIKIQELESKLELKELKPSIRNMENEVAEPQEEGDNLDSLIRSARKTRRVATRLCQQAKRSCEGNGNTQQDPIVIQID